MADGSLLRSGGETWGQWRQTMFTKQVSRRVDSPDPPSWPRRRSRSSQLEQRPGHRPDPRFLCPSGTNCGAGTDSSFDDHYGHGTHVAGIIGAEDNGEGVVGVAPGARLWAVRVMSAAGQGSTATALCGVDFVTSTRTDSDPTNDIAVASMSIGFSGPKVGDDGNCGLSNHDALHLAICNSTTAGVTYVVAAGNSAMDFRNDTPATYSEVLTVTAIADFNGQPGGGASPTCRTDVDDTYADFSSFATLVSDQAHTIAAPGVCILSTAAPKSLIWGGANAPLYGVLSGTSMATPHVAGTVALCIFSGPAPVCRQPRSSRRW